jgi:DNA-binding transcriptional regulator YiaG
MIATSLVQPTPEEIAEARLRAGLTQKEAALLVHAKSYRTWQDWEAGKNRMPLAAWELFLIKTGHRDGQR